MLLSFQACPDVQGTESTGEILNVQLTSPGDNPTCLFAFSPCRRRADLLSGMERR